MSHWFWKCECGVEGEVDTKNDSLASVVRAARAVHHCPDPDIVGVETPAKHERRLYEQHFHAGVF